MCVWQDSVREIWPGGLRDRQRQGSITCVPSALITGYWSARHCHGCCEQHGQQRGGNHLEAVAEITSGACKFTNAPLNPTCMRRPGGESLARHPIGSSRHCSTAPLWYQSAAVLVLGGLELVWSLNSPSLLLFTAAFVNLVLGARLCSLIASLIKLL